MRITFAALAFLAGSIVVAQVPPPPGNQQSQGVRARAQPTDYAAQARNSQAILAATVLPSQQVKQLFAYDISKTYIVVEVACYPGTGSVALRNSDFTVRLAAKGDIVNPAEAATVAAMIQRKTTPSAPGKSIPVYTEVNVGYESGTDPYTGRRVHSVYTGAGVGVGGPPAPSYPNSGGYPMDPTLLEDQLWRRSLPEGTFTRPAGGYLYFPISLLKKEKGFYLLAVQDENSNTWELRVPLAR